MGWMLVPSSYARDSALGSESLHHCSSCLSWPCITPPLSAPFSFSSLVCLAPFFTAFRQTAWIQAPPAELCFRSPLNFACLSWGRGHTSLALLAQSFSVTPRVWRIIYNSCNRCILPLPVDEFGSIFWSLFCRSKLFAIEFFASNGLVTSIWYPSYCWLATQITWYSMGRVVWLLQSGSPSECLRFRIPFLRILAQHSFKTSSGWDCSWRSSWKNECKRHMNIVTANSFKNSSLYCLPSSAYIGGDYDQSTEIW